MFDPPGLNLPIFLNLPMLFELTYHWKIKDSPVDVFSSDSNDKKLIGLSQLYSTLIQETVDPA